MLKSTDTLKNETIQSTVLEAMNSLNTTTFIMVVCAECGEELEYKVTLNHEYNIQIAVCQCDCGGQVRH